jgi:hypothetical protein
VVVSVGGENTAAAASSLFFVLFFLRQINFKQFATKLKKDCQSVVFCSDLCIRGDNDTAEIKVK